MPSLSAGALARRAAAIADRHRQNGLVSPASDPAVTALLRHARRTATPRHPPSPRPAQLARMAATCPRDLAGLRDRALLLLAGTGLGRGGLSRAVLVGLQVEQLRFTASGLELTLPGDDRTGRPPRVLVVPRGARPGGCPVQALRDWLQASATCSARCSARSTAGAMSSTARWAPTRSAASSRAVPRAAHAVAARRRHDARRGQDPGGGRRAAGLAAQPIVASGPAPRTTVAGTCRPP